MSEWTKEIARRLKDKEETQNLKAAKSLQDKKVRDQGVNTEWKNLLESLRKKCTELSEDEEVGIIIKVDDRVANRVSLSRQDTGALIRGELHPESYQYKFSGHNGSTYPATVFTLNLTENGLQWNIIDQRGLPIFNIDELADKLILALLGV